MKYRLLATLIVILVASCTAIPTPAPTPAPATAAPASASTSTATPTISTIEVDGVQVPDPWTTNPELFDVVSADAPIPQIAEAAGMAGIMLKRRAMASHIRFIGKRLDGTPIRNADGTRIFVAVYDLNPSPSETGEPLEGPVPLFVYQENDEGAMWDPMTLRELGEMSGIEMGTAISWLAPVPGLRDSDLKTLQRTQFSVGLVSLFWPTMEPKQSALDYSGKTQNADFAEDNDMVSLGAGIVWGSRVPDWLRNGDFSKDEISSILETRVRDTITQLARHGVVSFIVVNEAGAHDDFFMKTLGEGYIESAFQTARDAGKDLGLPLQLIYNDYNNHTSNGSRTKITQIIVRRLKDRGLIDAVGLEMLVDYPENPAEEDMIQTFRAYGVPVMITEAAVNMGRFRGTTVERDVAQAQIYQHIMDAAIKSSICSRIIIFTAVDENSPWVTETSLGSYSPENAPSLFRMVDGAIVAKPAVIAVEQALLRDVLR